MKALFEAISFLRNLKAADGAANKQQLQSEFVKTFRPAKARSIFVGDGYAFRFSEAMTGSFSNTVLSLSALQPYDHVPFVVVVVRARTVSFLLANSTFLRKISHSSLMLRPDNVKGSFNGSDIVTAYEGITNAPEAFEELFALHSAFTWTENLDRLVEATNAIVGRSSRFQPSNAEEAILFSAPDRAAEALKSPAFRAVEDELRGLVNERREAILSAALLDNVNLRGNTIEQLLTDAHNAHDLGDLTRNLERGLLVVDIKTKLLDRASAPKAYNVDKMLTFLSQPGSVFAFLMIGVDSRAKTLTVHLLPVLDAELLDATVIQHHWAGRASRGVTQLSGKLGHTTDADYQPRVDVPKALAFLKRLLSL
ncbi:hypothetical protein JQ628_29240 [Bradyrhizobium lablabi]|uniref:hypothetical protein n=1 Tax=Bradyrhizobium lablabi TaxID=722472 RepID=UPI001BABD95A|nr:hypothetical protein [Bradyrhizobium lablabi]MBR1125640.1 hypothetical protein [Bradyrhizobium lablabi]